MEISEKFQIPVAQGPMGDRFSGGMSTPGADQMAAAASRFNPAGSTSAPMPQMALRKTVPGVQPPIRHRTAKLSQAPSGAIDDSRRRAIMSTVDGLVNALQAESNDFVNKVYDRALESPRSVTDLSREMSEGEILTEMVFMIDALERVASKLEGGSIQPYLSADNKAALASLHEIYNNRRGRVPDAAKEPIARGHESLSSDYVDQRVKPLENLASDVDRMIVTAEGGTVDVHEPGESRSALELIGGVALLGLAAWGLYTFFSAD